MLQKLIFRHAVIDFSAQERSGKHSRHFSIFDIVAEYSTTTKKNYMPAYILNKLLLDLIGFHLLHVLN